MTNCASCAYSKVKGVTLKDGDLAMQFNRSLDATAGEGMFQQVEVAIRLAEASSHDLLVSYVVQAPMWKPTYRVVLPKEGKGEALLQGWAVVDNVSGEDWREVQLALTSGAPIAFRYDLHTPRDVPRADLTETGVRKQARVSVGETTYAEEPEEPEAEAAMEEDMDAPADDRFADKSVSRRSGGKGKRKANKPAAKAPPAAPPPPPPGYGGPMGGVAASETPAQVDMDSLRRSTAAQARATEVSGLTRFDLDTPVTVPDGTSTMVAIINAKVQGEETFLFRPGGAGMGYEQNPYRVVRFRNLHPLRARTGPHQHLRGRKLRR